MFLDGATWTKSIIQILIQDLNNHIIKLSTSRISHSDFDGMPGFGYCSSQCKLGYKR